MTAVWLPFKYRGFHDEPLAIVVEFKNDRYLLDRPFDEELDDYPDRYAVYRLPAAANLDGADWADLSQQGTLIGQLGRADVEFDATRRAAIRSRSLERLLKGC